MDEIVNPLTGETLSIFSDAGKTVLKNYLKTYTKILIGGSNKSTDTTKTRLLKYLENAENSNKSLPDIVISWNKYS